VDHRVEPQSWLPQGAAPETADPEADEAPASDDAHAPQDEAPEEGAAEEFSNGNGHDGSHTFTPDDSHAYSNEGSYAARGPFEEAAKPPFDELPASGFDSPPAPVPPAGFVGREQGTGYAGSGADAEPEDSEFDGSGAGARLADGGYGSAVVGEDVDSGSAVVDEPPPYVSGFAAPAVDEPLASPYVSGYAAPAATVALETGQAPQRAPYAYPPPPAPASVPPLAKGRPAVSARRANLVIARLEPWSVMKFSFLMSLVAWIVLFVAVALLYYALSSIGVFASLQKTLASVTSSQGSSGVDLSKWTSGTRILGYTMLIGAVDVVLITALSTVGAVVYNLVTHLGGGIEITLKETE
jgi:Transmembrane domain of unknown function (DUF3566)